MSGFLRLVLCHFFFYLSFSGITPAMAQSSMLEDAQQLADVLKSLDSLQTIVLLEGADPIYDWNGRSGSISGNTLLLQKPGRYSFRASADQIMTITVSYGNKEIRLQSPGTAELLFSPERSDLYSDHPEAVPAVNQMLDHFPEAFYVLTKYLGSDHDPTALKRLLANPFFSPQLGPWLPKESLLRDRLRTHSLKERSRSDSETALASTINKPVKASVFAPTVPTAPERLQAASEALYASQGGILSGGIDQTALIRGLATFIEKRAQEELNMLFLERMRKKLETTRFGLLFPNTLTLFTQFEIDQYHMLLDNAYPYFQRDLQGIGRNFPRLLRNDTTLQHLRYNPNVLNAAHFLELTNLALLGNEMDSILRRANQIYATEQGTMQGLWRSTFAQQIRATNFQQDFLTPIHDLVTGWNTQEASIRQVMDTLSNYTKPSVLGPQIVETAEWEILRQRLAALDAQIANEQYFLQRDRTPTWDRFSELVQLFAQSDPALLFAEAQLSDYNRYIGRMQSDSLFAAELVRLAEEVLSGQLVSYQDEALASAKKGFDELSQILLEAEALRQKGLVERGLRLLQIDYFLKQGIDEELAFWRESQDTIRESTDTLALRFFESVLVNEANTTRMDNITNGFLNSTLPLTFNPKLSDQFSEIEAFQDSLMVILMPHTDRLAKTTQKVKGSTSFGGIAAAWESIKEKVVQKFSMVAQDADPDAIDLLQTEIADVYSSLLSRDIQSPESTVDESHNPFLAKASVLHNRPPFSLPGDLLRQRQHLNEVDRQLVLLQAERVKQRKNLDQELDKKANYAFLRAKENAHNLKRISDLTLALVESFQYQDTIMVAEQLSVRRQAESTAMETTTSGNQTTRSLRDTIVTQVRLIPKVQRWITLEKLDTVMNDPMLRRAFLGLLYQRVSAIEGLSIDPATLGLLAVQTVELIDATHKARTKAMAARDSTGKADLVHFLPVARGVLRLFSVILDVPVGGQTVAEQLQLEGVNAILDNTLGTYEYLAQEDYGQALTSTMGLYQAFAQDEQERKSDRVEAYQLQQSILRYGHFAADMVQATASDEVQSILQQYATPIGSSRQKRSNSLNVSLNAYVGPSLAFEGAIGKVEGARSSLVGSLSTPVGLAFSWRTAQPRKDNLIFRSWTAFASFLDIGPVVSYNFQEGALASTPALQFKDFIAPGVFLFYNVPRSPFSGGMGYQQTAAIRAINADGIESQNYRAGRLTLFLGIDVPLFSFFTKP